MIKLTHLKKASTIVGTSTVLFIGLLGFLSHVTLTGINNIDATVDTMLETTLLKSVHLQSLSDLSVLEIQTLERNDPTPIESFTKQFNQIERDLTELNMSSHELALLTKQKSISTNIKNLHNKLDSLVFSSLEAQNIKSTIILEYINRLTILNQMNKIQQTRVMNSATNIDNTVHTVVELIQDLTLELVLLVIIVGGILARHVHKIESTLSHSATHDTLTNIYNRKGFDDVMQDLESGIDDKEHSVLLLDLDKFKIVNDTCGHAAGDKLLKMVTERMKRHIRKNDVFARLGGDEFGIILTECGREKAKEITENILRECRELDFLWEGDVFKITTSIGIASMVSGVGVEKVLKLADDAMYEAKADGRDCLRCAS